MDSHWTNDVIRFLVIAAKEYLEEVIASLVEAFEDDKVVENSRNPVHAAGFDCCKLKSLAKLSPTKSVHDDSYLSIN